MDRWWLLTWTTYGTWLPGDPRGSVTSVRTGPRPRVEHDLPGMPVEPPMPGLHAAAAEAMRGPPIYLTLEQAEVILGESELAAFELLRAGRADAFASTRQFLVRISTNLPGSRVLEDRYAGIDDRTAFARNGRCHISLLVAGRPLGRLLCRRQVEADRHRWWIRPNAGCSNDRTWRDLEQQWNNSLRTQQ